MPRLARITIYPVKSLDGVDVPEAMVLPSGALEHDRRFAMVDTDGELITGKRTAQVHQIRSSYDPSSRVLTLGDRNHEVNDSFHVDADRDALNAWLSRHFGLPVALHEAPETGFPDDTDAPGPTAIARASLDAVSEWFGGLDPDDCRGRFRANLEIGDSEPFWDDRLYAETGQGVLFRVGGVVFEGVNPCQRCPVPTRDPMTGEPIHGFPKRFSALREATLPPWATRSRFDHFYRMAVNTRLPDALSGVIHVGDLVEILPPS